MRVVLLCLNQKRGAKESSQSGFWRFDFASSRNFRVKSDVKTRSEAPHEAQAKDKKRSKTRSHMVLHCQWSVVGVKHHTKAGRLSVSKLYVPAIFMQEFGEMQWDETNCGDQIREPKSKECLRGKNTWPALSPTAKPGQPTPFCVLQ